MLIDAHLPNLPAIVLEDPQNHLHAAERLVIRRRGFALADVVGAVDRTVDLDRAILNCASRRVRQYQPLSSRPFVPWSHYFRRHLHRRRRSHSETTRCRKLRSPVRAHCRSRGCSGCSQSKNQGTTDDEKVRLANAGGGSDRGSRLHRQASCDSEYSHSRDRHTPLVRRTDTRRWRWHCCVRSSPLPVELPTAFILSGLS